MACAALCAMVWATPANAAFPGQNGKIAFVRANGIWTVNPDGSSRTQITTGARDQNPRWSPDGTQIVFTSTRADPNPLTCTSCHYEVYLMGADGSDINRVTNTPGFAYSYGASWSPDGTRIAFGRPGGHIWTINPDGTDEQRITPDRTNPECYSLYGGTAAWSPDGKEVATNGSSLCYEHEYAISAILLVSSGTPSSYWVTTGADEIEDWSPDSGRVVFGTMGLESGTGMYTIGPTGFNELTDTTFDDGFAGAGWSPHGEQIVFARATSYGSDWLLHILDAADGGNVTQLSAGDAYESSPDWQPIPVNAYPRPKGASPMEVSLVPAYEPCTSATRQHGPPLAFPSCNPPAQKPGQLTVGTPDANGQPAKSNGNLRINPMRGDPSTPADEADVRLRANITDVRLRSDLSDYTGSLEVRLSLQITDRDNTPHPGGPGPATVQQFTHSHPLPCSATSNTTVGSTCGFDTTIEALVPGAVKELKRGIWELGAIRVHDGAGNLFLTPGVFVP